MSLSDEIRARHKAFPSMKLCRDCGQPWRCDAIRAAEELDRLTGPGTIVIRTDGPHGKRFDNTAAAPAYMPSREGKE